MKRKQFGVIGLGRFGSAMAMTLTELGHDVIGVDGDESRVQQLADVITHALQIDATDEKALRACRHSGRRCGGCFHWGEH